VPDQAPCPELLSTLPAPARAGAGPIDLPRERVLADGPRALSDADLVALVVGTGAAGRSARATALGLVEAVPLAELAWAPPDAIAAFPGIGPARAAALAAAFELGRRGAWAPPRRGERCLDPGRVHELLRHAAHAEREQFHVVLLDVRGRLLRVVQVAEGSLAQCPVSPRDALRPAVREGAHSVVFAHNHPSGDPSPSADDVDLTERLRAAADLVGVLARDHVIVAASGYYSFVAAGRWRR
jgi:DNA repair protein RadC